MNAALVRFFLGSHFFRPANHPVLPFAIVTILVFQGLGSIDRTHVGVIVYGAVLAHGMVGGLFRSEESGATPVTRFMRGLPLARRTVVRSYVAAAAVHGLVATALLGGLLGHFAKLPRWESLEVVEGEDEFGHPALIVRGLERDARRIFYEAGG